MSKQIKNCPFCGSSDVHIADIADSGTQWYVYCRACSFFGRWLDQKYKTQNEVINGKEIVLNRWNTRAKDDE